ncbi:MAG TPA: DUF2950 domain-containing protein [Mesorhizobium sp.]|nr:DUF2950 domain-containing protein [Mesorhizobium sp.]
MDRTLHHPLLRSICMAALVTGLVAATPAVTFAQEESPSAAASPADEEYGIFDYEAAEEPPLFDDPAKAIDALKSGLAANDFDGVAKLLGLDAGKLKQAEGVMDTFAQIRDAAAKKIVVVDREGGKILQLGDKLWPFPFPVLKGDDDGKWAFDTEAGLEEIVNRRVGENELQAIATMREYIEAQNDYASEDRDADGVDEFAQKLVSSEGTTDGLYWPADLGFGESPAGDFVDQAELEDASKGEGYFGYRFRILTGQGDKVAGGAYDYVINGNMIGGFGLIAWPVKYAETGVNTFIVNQHGIVYQADLGPSTGDIVKYIDRFNPDDAWEVAND